jgi:sugar phosphate isomerase/epimerase
MYSEFSCFITRCGNHTTLIGSSPDYNWLAAQIGTIEQLNRNKERIHVHMKDVRNTWSGKIFRFGM